MIILNNRLTEYETFDYLVLSTHGSSIPGTPNSHQNQSQLNRSRLVHNFLVSGRWCTLKLVTRIAAGGSRLPTVQL